MSATYKSSTATVVPAIKRVSWGAIFVGVVVGRQLGHPQFTLAAPEGTIG